MGAGGWGGRRPGGAAGAPARPDSRYPKIDRVAVVSRARLRVCRRYRDDVRLDWRYPKIDRVALVSRARLDVRRRYYEDVRLDSRYPKIDGVAVVSRARLGVRRRYRDDVRLDSRYAKTGWEWCHVLLLMSIVATARTSASTRVTLR